MQAFFDQAFFQSLVTNVLGVVIGAGVGIPVGLWLNRRGQATATRQAAAEVERERLQDLQQTLRGIREAVSHNRELLRQCNHDLADGSGIDTIYYNVDARGIDIFVPALVARTRDFDLVNAVNNFRYQLWHIARKIDSHYELEFGAAAGIGGARIQRRDTILASIREHGPKLLDEADGLTSRLDAALTAAVTEVGRLRPPPE